VLSVVLGRIASQQGVWEVLRSSHRCCKPEAEHLRQRQSFLAGARRSTARHITYLPAGGKGNFEVYARCRHTTYLPARGEGNFYLLGGTGARPGHPGTTANLHLSSARHRRLGRASSIISSVCKLRSRVGVWAGAKESTYEGRTG
jgi:hypothetical protein